LRRAVSDIISSVKILAFIGCFVAREFEEPFPEGMHRAKAIIEKWAKP